MDGDKKRPETLKIEANGDVLEVHAPHGHGHIVLDVETAVLNRDAVPAERYGEGLAGPGLGDDGLDRHLAIVAAAEDLPRDEFEAAYRRAHDGRADEDYLKGIWPQWKSGGLGWLACRSSTRETAETYAAVLLYRDRSEEDAVEVKSFWRQMRADALLEVPSGAFRRDETPPPLDVNEVLAWEGAEHGWTTAHRGGENRDGVFTPDTIGRDDNWWVWSFGITARFLWWRRAVPAPPDSIHPAESPGPDSNPWDAVDEHLKAAIGAIEKIDGEDPDDDDVRAIWAEAHQLLEDMMPFTTIAVPPPVLFRWDEVLPLPDVDEVEVWVGRKGWVSVYRDPDKREQWTFFKGRNLPGISGQFKEWRHVVPTPPEDAR